MSFHKIFGSTLSYNLCFQSPIVRMEEETQKKNQDTFICAVCLVCFLPKSTYSITNNISPLPNKFFCAKKCETAASVSRVSQKTSGGTL